MKGCAVKISGFFTLIFMVLACLRSPARCDDAAPLILQVTPAKDTVYPGERLPLTVTLLVGPAQVRNLGYPRIDGGSRAYSVAPFAPPQERSVTREGGEWRGYDFRTTLTAKRSGTVEVGAVELSCDVMEPAAGSAAFFGGAEPRRVVVRADPFPLRVLPFPARGRPGTFRGAVGRFTVTRSARPTTVAVGDPVTVKTVLRGERDLDSFSCESVAVDGLRSYSPRIRRGTGTVACEQVVIPVSTAALSIPPYRIAFFDPAVGRYGTATTPAIALTVTPPSRQAAPDVTPPSPKIRSAAGDTDPHPDPPLEGEGVAGVAVVGVVGLLLVALALSAVLKRRRRRSAVSGADGEHRASTADLVAAAEAALAAGDVENFYTAVFRAVQQTVGDRLGCPPAGVTSVSAGGEGVETADGCCDLFARCDLVRYGNHRPAPAEMAADNVKLLQLLQKMAP